MSESGHLMAPSPGLRLEIVDPHLSAEAQFVQHLASADDLDLEGIVSFVQGYFERWRNEEYPHFPRQ